MPKGGRVSERLARRRRHFANTDGHLVKGARYAGVRGRAGVEGDNITIPGIEQRFSTYRDRDRPTTSSGAAPAATSEITVFSHLFFLSHALFDLSFDHWT